MALSERVCGARGKSSGTPLAAASSGSIGPMSHATGTSAPLSPFAGSISSVEVPLASPFLAPAPGSAEARRMTASSGLRCFASSRLSGPLGFWLRMSLASTVPASSKWYLTWKATATKSRRRLKFRLVPSDTTIGGRATGFSATPTTKANQACPSMQKWPSCRLAGEVSPKNWERRMGFPDGWTE